MSFFVLSKKSVDSIEENVNVILLDGLTVGKNRTPYQCERVGVIGCLIDDREDIRVTAEPI